LLITVFITWETTNVYRQNTTCCIRQRHMITITQIFTCAKVRIRAVSNCRSLLRWWQIFHTPWEECFWVATEYITLPNAPQEVQYIAGTALHVIFTRQMYIPTNGLSESQCPVTHLYVRNTYSINEWIFTQYDIGELYKNLIIWMTTLLANLPVFLYAMSTDLTFKPQNAT